MTRALVQFTDEQIQEDLAFVREEFPDEPANLLPGSAASYLDFVCSPESHDDAEAQVMAYLAREHVERGR